MPYSNHDTNGDAAISRTPIRPITRHLALAMLTTVLLASQANATPSTTTIDVRTDDRIDHVERTRTNHNFDGLLNPPEFEFTITLPATYNSNPSQDNSGQTSVHFDPELTLDWKHQFTSVPIKIAARLDTDFDRYTDTGTDDSDTAYAFLNLSYTDGSKTALAVPYAGYRVTMGFAPTYGARQFTFNDFYGGIRFNGVLGFDFIDIQGGRRSSTVLSSDYVDLKGSFAHKINGEWAFNVTPRLKLRWFDGVAGFHRFDVTPIVVAYFSYTPTTSFSGSPEIDLGVTYLNNDSNKAGASFDQWDVGPSVTLLWDF